jgi:FKBP-type peptidyl-prolyl cis-trans isomerase
MATRTSQRVGIWIIAIVLAVGTIGSFLAIIFSNQNDVADQAKMQKLYEQYQSDLSDYNAKSDAQAKQLSKRYYGEFSKYSKVPAKFDPSEVKVVKTEDLKIGDGVEIKSDTKYGAYYIGWNPKGVVFDQSISDGSLKAPISGGGLIDGWEEGVKGMKMGGIRLISIPSNKAYGETGSGDNIPPNTPIKFVVMVIPQPKQIPAASMPQELIDYYESQ